MSERIEYQKQFRSKPDSKWYDTIHCWTEENYLKHKEEIDENIRDHLWLWGVQQSDTRLVRRVIHDETVISTEDMHDHDFPVSEYQSDGDHE